MAIRVPIAVALLALNFCAAEDFQHIYGLDCSSRRKDHPAQENGAPLQYVHIPKAAGSSIQQYLAAEIAKRFNLPLGSLDQRKRQACPKDDREWSPGGIYSGHCPIVSAHNVTDKPRPFFVVSAREPVARWTSNFNYIARSYNHFDHKVLLKEMAKFMRDGLEGDKIFAEMLRNHHPFAMSLLNRTQWSFLVPMGCNVLRTSPTVNIASLARQNKNMAKAVLLRNLLRSDLVVTMDLLDTFVMQMVYHLDYGQILSPDHKLGHILDINRAQHGAPAQILDQQALEAFAHGWIAGV